LTANTFPIRASSGIGRAASLRVGASSSVSPSSTAPIDSSRADAATFLEGCVGDFSSSSPAHTARPSAPSRQPPPTHAAAEAGLQHAVRVAAAVRGLHVFRLEKSIAPARARRIPRGLLSNSQAVPRRTGSVGVGLLRPRPGWPPLRRPHAAAQPAHTDTPHGQECSTLGTAELLLSQTAAKI
jgi:hypothetical protein